jgi:hypothetical protein
MLYAFPRFVLFWISAPCGLVGRYQHSKIVVEWLLLIRILEILSSNLDPKTGYRN